MHAHRHKCIIKQEAAGQINPHVINLNHLNHLHGTRPCRQRLFSPSISVAAVPHSLRLSSETESRQICWNASRWGWCGRVGRRSEALVVWLRRANANNVNKNFSTSCCLCMEWHHLRQQRWKTEFKAKKVSELLLNIKLTVLIRGKCKWFWLNDRRAVYFPRWNLIYVKETWWWIIEIQT